MAKTTFDLLVINILVLLIRAENVEEIPSLRYLNLEVDPCEDFYEYTCGNFKLEHPLPDGALTVDQYTILEEKLKKLSNKILSSPQRDEDPQALKKAKMAYQSCVDLPYIDLKVEPELSVVQQQHGFPLVQTLLHEGSTEFGWNDIADAVSEYGIPLMFNIQVTSNYEDPSQNLIYISSTDMTLPSQIRSDVFGSYEDVIERGFLDSAKSETFQLRSLKSSPPLKPFDIYLRKMAEKLRKATQSFIDQETMLRNIEVMSNFMRGVFLGGFIPENTEIKLISNGTYSTLGRLNEWTKEHFGDSVKIDWVEYMRRVFSTSGQKIGEDTQVMTPTNLGRLLFGILNWVNMNNPETVKSFVMMRIYLFMAADGDAESRAILEEYLTTQKVRILPRWEYCTRKIIDSVDTAGMSFAVAYEYQLRHFDVNGLGKALEMIRDLQSVYRESLQNAMWMDDECKAKAVQKFDNMITILAYPDLVPEPELLDQFYENLRICGWDNYGNTKRIKAFRNAYRMSQVGKRDRALFLACPQSSYKICEFYQVFHFFFSILDYGRIGSIIGHEITHGFDAEGRKYDANGTLTSWWTAETKAAFDERTECFVDQYNKYYVPEIDAYVNGTKTLNENLADNGGVRQSYYSMKKMLERTGANGNTAGLTPEQLFFIGFGTAWCSNPSVEYLEQMKADVHAQSKWRVNGVVSNMQEFSEAFKCPVGSKMNPSNKCRLW
nr:neprilysin-4-like [Leptinotarsa decemlineata]